MDRAAQRGTMTKTDAQLKADIETELRWDPSVNAAQIGVTVDKGAVSLLGTVDTYAQRWAAEAAAKRVGGVRTLAQDLVVKLGSPHHRNDSEIASAIQSALTWDVHVPTSITAKVVDGIVTLEGQCTWDYERESAVRAVHSLIGVISVYNEIVLKPVMSADAVKDTVEAALQRQATADASSIHIATSGSKVTLTGEVSSWSSAEDATRSAWAAPGVTEVIDRLTVSNES